MVQLSFLAGKMAGTSWVTRRFPVRAGRGSACELRLEDAGVWDRHFQIAAKGTDGFEIKAEPNALIRVNGQAAEHSQLRNGDTIELGDCKLQFWLSPNEQKGFRLREWLTWIGIAAVCLGQVALVYWLLR